MDWMSVGAIRVITTVPNHHEIDFRSEMGTVLMSARV